MSDRDTILARIKQNKPEEKPLPKSFQRKSNSKEEENQLTSLKENFKKAGADVINFETKDILLEYLQNNSLKTINLLNGVTKEQYQNNKILKSELEKTQVLVIEGQFGVAENGAIWITENDIATRLLPFITEQLLIVLNKQQIVATMHEAYKKIQFEEISFGAFISGPSKTADIEQSLVYGAHGAKKLLILIY